MGRGGFRSSVFDRISNRIEYRIGLMQNLMYSMMSNSNRFPISQFDSMAIESNWTEFRIGFQMMNSVFDSIRFDEFGGCNVKRYVLSTKRRFVRYIHRIHECNVKDELLDVLMAVFTLHFTIVSLFPPFATTPSPR